ncbi:hypothetical protein IFR05_015231 [Cadophora sp. M221]|nr:hypothetical protein IFR05_015231 [Cadophora sp. M221]
MSCSPSPEPVVLEPEAPKPEAEPETPPWQDAFVKPLKKIAKNTSETAKYTWQANGLLEQLDTGLLDISRVLETLHTEAENHSTALLLVLQKEEAILAKLTEKTAAAKPHSGSRSSSRSGPRSGLQSSSRPGSPLDLRPHSPSVIAHTALWAYNLPAMEVLLSLWLAFVLFMMWHCGNPRNLRYFLRGTQDPPLNSRTALEVKNILLRSLNWKELLDGTRVPFECLRVGGARPVGPCPWE